MTEAEWMACTDPQKMLEFVRGKASNRKLRLFACGCVRSIWRFLMGEISQRAVVVAEKYAGGEPTATENEMYDLETGGVQYAKGISKGEWPKGWTPSEMAAYYAAIAAADCCRLSCLPTSEGAIWWVDQAGWVATATSWAVGYSAGATFLATTGEMSGTPAADAERAIQVGILHDLFGPPPFRPVALESSWLAWNDGTVVKLAQGIYEDRAFDRLPILAGALEEAGCHDADILSHCRQPGRHVLGCWVIDSILRRD